MWWWIKSLLKSTNLLPCESIPSSEFIQLVFNSREGYIRQRICYGCKLYRLICEILTSVKSQLHLKHQTTRVMHMRMYDVQFSRIDSITAKVLHMLPCTILSTHIDIKQDAHEWLTGPAMETASWCLPDFKKVTNIPRAAEYHWHGSWDYPQQLDHQERQSKLRF